MAGYTDYLKIGNFGNGVKSPMTGFTNPLGSNDFGVGANYPKTSFNDYLGLGDYGIRANSPMDMNWGGLRGENTIPQIPQIQQQTMPNSSNWLQEQIQNIYQPQQSSINTLPPVPGTTTPGTWVDGMSNFETGKLGLGAAGGIAQLLMGMKTYGLAKDQLAFSKDSFNKQYAAQRQTTNASLEDRQNARWESAGGSRVASNPYQSPSVYMDKNRIA